MWSWSCFVIRLVHCWPNVAAPSFTWITVDCYKWRNIKYPPCFIFFTLICTSFLSFYFSLKLNISNTSHKEEIISELYKITAFWVFIVCLFFYWCCKNLELWLDFSSHTQLDCVSFIREVNLKWRRDKVHLQGT